MVEHVFYLARAHIVGVKSATEYRIWLVDHRNAPWVDEYKAGKHMVPEADCIDVNLAFTLDKPGPQGQVHFLKAHVGNGASFALTTIFRKVPFENAAFGQVAIHETLWKKVPAASRPLSPQHAEHPPEDYRLKLVTRSDVGAVKAFFGFHVKVVETRAEPPGSRITFFSWVDKELGTDWFDLSSDMFDAAHSTIKPSSGPGTQGSLFVSLDRFKDVPFLELGKVPFNGQTG